MCARRRPQSSTRRRSWLRCCVAVSAAPTSPTIARCCWKCATGWRGAVTAATRWASRCPASPTLA
eukprot:9931582-Lingulodinium_polyedra.AAC.1